MLLIFLLIMGINCSKATEEDTRQKEISLLGYIEKAIKEGRYSESKVSELILNEDMTNSTYRDVLEIALDSKSRIAKDIFYYLIKGISISPVSIENDLFCLALKKDRQIAYTLLPYYSSKYCLDDFSPDGKRHFIEFVVYSEFTLEEKVKFINLLINELSESDIVRIVEDLAIKISLKGSKVLFLETSMYTLAKIGYEMIFDQVVDIYEKYKESNSTGTFNLLRYRVEMAYKLYKKLNLKDIPERDPNLMFYSMISLLKVITYEMKKNLVNGDNLHKEYMGRLAEEHVNIYNLWNKKDENSMKSVEYLYNKAKESRKMIDEDPEGFYVEMEDTNDSRVNIKKPKNLPRITEKMKRRALKNSRENSEKNSKNNRSGRILPKTSYKKAERLAPLIELLNIIDGKVEEKRDKKIKIKKGKDLLDSAVIDFLKTNNFDNIKDEIAAVDEKSVSGLKLGSILLSKRGFKLSKNVSLKEEYKSIESSLFSAMLIIIKRDYLTARGRIGIRVEHILNSLNKNVLFRFKDYLESKTFGTHTEFEGDLLDKIKSKLTD